MAQEKKQGGCLSTFFGTFAALGIFGFVIVGCCVVVCIGVIVLAAIGSNAQQNKTVDLNNGAGTKDKPIAAGEWAIFEGASIRATKILRPADRQVEQMNMFNDEAAAGTEYVLVWFELQCKQDSCNPDVNGSFRLIDGAGKEWGEPFVLNLDDDLGGNSAINGASLDGWQGFQYPKDVPISLIQIGWSSVELYTLPPVQE